MSNFVKPSTPTKIRSNIKALTPTKSKSMSSINISGSNNFSEKISEENLYLHLEALKRNLDNEMVIKQKLEEAYKSFEERRFKYLNLVAKYAALVRLAYTRKTLLRNDLLEVSTTTAQTDAKNIKKNLSSGSASDYISITEIQKFKNILHQLGTYENLPTRRSELVEFKNATDAIRYSIEAIEKSLEKCTIESMEHITKSLNMENYPKLLKEYDFNEY